MEPWKVFMESGSVEYVKPVSVEAARLFDELEDWADESWRCLSIDVWAHRLDADQDTEALVSVLELDHRCAQLMAKQELVLIPNRNYDRYELLASALVVRHTIPIAEELRPPFRRSLLDDFDMCLGWQQTPPGDHLAAVEH